MSSDKQNAEEGIIEKEPENHQINLPIDVTCSYDSADQCEDEINDNFSSFETVLELKQICNEINNIVEDLVLEKRAIDCLNDTLNVDQILTRIKKLESYLKSLSKYKKSNIKKMWKVDLEVLDDLIVQLESIIVILQGHLKIINILNQIRNNASQMSSENSKTSSNYSPNLSSDQSLERPAAVFTLGNKSSDEKYSEEKDNETEEEQQHKLETNEEQNQEEKDGNIFARFRNKMKQNKQVEQDTHEEDGSDQKETKYNNMNENTQHESNSDMSGDKQQENISKMSDDNQHEIQSSKSDDNKHESPGNKSDDKYQK